MEIYFTDKDYRTYKITKIEYSDEDYDNYSRTRVFIERNDIEKHYCFSGILSLESIIRELSRLDLGCDED